MKLPMLCNALRWTWAQTRFRWAVHCATSALLGLSMVVLLLVMASPGWLDQKAQADVGQVDLIVAGKGSALQWTLATLYHVDSPPSNVSLVAVNTLMNQARIAQHIANRVYVAMGDSVGGARIVGADSLSQYLALFDAAVDHGQLPNQAMHAAVGASVAQRLKLGLGSQFFSSHGIEAGGSSHEDAAYTVTAVLKPTGTVLDTLVLTPIESIWLSHEGKPRDAQEAHLLAQVRDITAVLVQYKYPLSALALPKLLNNAATPDMTIAPIAEQLQRLWRLFDPFFLLLAGLAGLLAFCAVVGVLLTAHLTQAQRLRDLAVLRLLGARPGTLCALLALDALLQWLCACALAIIALACLGWGWAGLSHQPLSALIASMIPALLKVCAGAGLVLILAHARAAIRLLRAAPATLLQAH